MENETRKRVAPHPILAAVVETLVPVAFRKGPDGDWREECVSPRQYINEAVRSIPAMVAGQVRRTFSGIFVGGEAVILFCSFAGAPAVPLAIVIGFVLAVLILRDAYIHPHRRSHVDAVPHAMFASAVVFFSQIVLGMAAPSLAVPYLTTIRGVSLSLMLMSAWRLIFFLSLASVLPRALTLAYRETWRTNILWLVASIGLFHSAMNAVPEVLSGRDLLLGMMPAMTLGIAHRLQMDIPGKIARMAAPLSVFGAPGKNELSIRQQRLLSRPRTFASAGSGAIVFEALFFGLLAWPLGSALLRWSVDNSAMVDWPAVWTSLGAMLPLSGAWIYVRTLNRQTAQQVQEEIDVLDEREGK